MPEIDFPNWLEWVLVIGAVSGSFTAIILFAVKVSKGLTWVGKTHQAAILAPALSDINRLDDKLDGLLEQLTSDNNGSLREQINGTRREVRELHNIVEKHIVAYNSRNIEIDKKFEQYGIAGPICDD